MEKSLSINHLEKTGTQEELFFSEGIIEGTMPVGSSEAPITNFGDMLSLGTGETAHSKNDISRDGTLGVIIESGLEIISSDITCPKAQVRVNKFRVKIEE